MVSPESRWTVSPSTTETTPPLSGPHGEPPPPQAASALITSVRSTGRAVVVGAVEESGGGRGQAEGRRGGRIALARPSLGVRRPGRLVEHGAADAHEHAGAAVGG